MKNINGHLKKSFNDLTEVDIKEIIGSLCLRLNIEHSKNDKSGIYCKTQYMFAYNSNHMEGSTLTIDQTRNLFQTGTLPQSPKDYIAKDIEEAQGHFLMFNEMLYSYSSTLTEELIKKYHFRLKQGVFEDLANGYPCGDYKNRENFVSDINTAKPNEVPERMKELLDWYSIQDKTLENLLKFHAKYEEIHPFQDGNGRTGRMILFRECLKNNIIPVIFMQSALLDYKKALNKAQIENDFSDIMEIAKENQSYYYQDIKTFLFEYSLEQNKYIKDRIEDVKDVSKDEKKNNDIER